MDRRGIDPLADPYGRNHLELREDTMPFLYESASKQQLENFTTNGSANTENDSFFITPGASRPVGVAAFRVQGKGAGLTALSGISIRLKQWTSTASVSTTTAASGSTSTTPAPKCKIAPACVATAGMITAATNVVKPGTGGPVQVGYASCGASGPGGWVAINPDDVPELDGGATMSMDLFSSSPTVSLNWEFVLDSQEG